MGVNAKCKNCNKEADSETFKLHYKYKMMVCQDCFSGRTEKRQKIFERQEAPPKPAGWDKEDEYLEKITKLKQKEIKSQFKKIPGTDHVMYNCNMCKYSFRYNPFKKLPRSCPYCSADIPKLRTFSLL
ncbi:MAG: hypothetical protein KKH52_03915 [Nanoarchaeota archaeon]|nr:hypothetical protein [Nanoarchaeota archaeon]MBU1622216.1 hypothetical protein [Nanoarchaeota archaeon]MBU1974515.1 hypothetical protein [Nanoarchaeota archaeon]